MQASTEPLYSTLNDPDLADIVEMFVGEMPERIEGLEQCRKAGDWESLRRKAHQLKGAAGSYGYLPITDLAGRLENTIRGNQPEDAILRSLGELISLCRRVRSGADR